MAVSPPSGRTPAAGAGQKTGVLGAGPAVARSAVGEVGVVAVRPTAVRAGAQPAEAQVEVTPMAVQAEGQAVAPSGVAAAACQMQA